MPKGTAKGKTPTEKPSTLILGDIGAIELNALLLRGKILLSSVPDTRVTSEWIEGLIQQLTMIPDLRAEVSKILEGYADASTQQKKSMLTELSTFLDEHSDTIRFGGELALLLLQVVASGLGP